MYDESRFRRTFQMARPHFNWIVEEYLRKPTMTDIVKLYRHHEEKQEFSRMLGILYCTHWEWSNKDIDVLHQSPLFNDLKTGRALEIPFVANGVTYPWRYYLVDGIYSELATLVKTIPEPSHDDYKRIRYGEKKKKVEATLKWMVKHGDHYLQSYIYIEELRRIEEHMKPFLTTFSRSQGHAKASYGTIFIITMRMLVVVMIRVCNVLVVLRIRV
nr:hypothetical protein [Tanacetum cinerariifolium]GEY91679.1 hypothetical protein [Tanacetum cinerariifolium]